MNKLKLYYDTLSQPSRVLKLFLLVNKIPYDDVPVNLAKGQHMEPDFGKVNRFHKVPAIEHNGFPLTESVAIVRYLCRELKVPDHWYPKDSKLQAKVDEYLEWQHNNTRIFCAMYFQHKVLIPMFSGKPIDEKMLKFYQKGMEKTLDTINNVWLKDQKYLCGDTISVADLFGICELEQPRLGGYEVGKDHPAVKAYMERVQKDLQPHYAEVMTRFDKFIAKYSSTTSSKL